MPYCIGLITCHVNCGVLCSNVRQFKAATQFADHSPCTRDKHCVIASWRKTNRFSDLPPTFALSSIPAEMRQRNIDGEAAGQFDNPIVKTWLAHLDRNTNAVPVPETRNTSTTPGFLHDNTKYHPPSRRAKRKRISLLAPPAKRRVPFQDTPANRMRRWKDGDKDTIQPAKERNQKSLTRASTRTGFSERDYKEIGRYAISRGEKRKGCRGR